MVDLCVLDRDLLSVDPDTICEIKVEMRIVNGEIVLERT